MFGKKILVQIVFFSCCLSKDSTYFVLKGIDEIFLFSDAQLQYTSLFQNFQVVF